MISIEKTISTTAIYSGRIVRLERLEVEMENGQRATREIVRHRGAAAVLCRLPDGRYIFVKQYRKPIDQFLVEVVAGGMDEGETPEECAIREVHEETGYAVKSIRSLGQIVSCPGYCDEILHGFFVELEERAGQTDPDEDENVETVVLSKDEVEAQIRSGQLWDGKTLALWLKHEMHKI